MLVLSSLRKLFPTDDSVLSQKLFWVGVLYFAQGFPAGVFWEILPVHFRTLGVDLSDIGLLGIVGLGWTLKFLWAPLISYTRHYRRWMLVMDLLMAITVGAIAAQSGADAWMWILIGTLVVLSATNDIAIDGYTIEMLNKNEMGIANGFRIGFYRVGLLATGGLLMLQSYIGWVGIYLGIAAILVVCGFACFVAPKEHAYAVPAEVSVLEELGNIFKSPLAGGVLLLLSAFTMFLVGPKVATGEPYELAVQIFTREIVLQFTTYEFVTIVMAVTGAGLFVFDRLRVRIEPDQNTAKTSLSGGPIFGALIDMVQRPGMIMVFIFVLTFKLADTTMGLMVKPFWVDAGFTPGQIGAVSVNIGILLSILGGASGGLITDRIGIFHGLWVLGLTQAVSNLGYAYVATVIPTGVEGYVPGFGEQAMLYAASGIESFTQGLGTGAFLAFLMAIVNKNRSATEYAILSAIFILSRSVAGWTGGHGAEIMGYPDFFLLTFFLGFPAYLLLPWVKKILAYAESQTDWDHR